VRCPRCHRETSDPAPAFCRGCGAPLRLPDEPPPRPLEVPLAIDRRDAERSAVDATVELPPPPPLATAARAPPAAAARAELAELERSHWNLGPPIGVPADPAPRSSAPGLARVAAAAAEPVVALPETAPEEPFPDAEVDALEIRLRRPESWRRVAAGALDALPFVAAGLALATTLLRDASAGLPAPAVGLDGLLDLVAREQVIVLSVAAAVTLAHFVYATLAHALAGATLGKRLLGLRVAGPDGGRPSLGRSAARAGLAVLSGALLGLGLLLALFTGSGRALHDLLARTWVVEAR
jgi:uncharacterized RDD family membrane protein YckC